jgi:hypothetical protein
MTGKIVEINQRRGMVAVECEDGSFSVFELLGDFVEVGDEVRWQGDHPLGSETINNLTQGARVDVYFQNHCVPRARLRRQLLY